MIGGNRFRAWCDQAGPLHCSAHELGMAAATRLADSAWTRFAQEQRGSTGKRGSGPACGKMLTELVKNAPMALPRGARRPASESGGWRGSA